MLTYADICRHSLHRLCGHNCLWSLLISESPRPPPVPSACPPSMRIGGPRVFQTKGAWGAVCKRACLHTSAYVSICIRQHTSAYVSICIRQLSARERASIRQHTSAYVSIRVRKIAPGARTTPLRFLGLKLLMLNNPQALVA